MAQVKEYRELNNGVSLTNNGVTWHEKRHEKIIHAVRG